MHKKLEHDPIESYFSDSSGINDIGLDDDFEFSAAYVAETPGWWEDQHGDRYVTAAKKHGGFKPIKVVVIVGPPCVFYFSDKFITEKSSSRFKMLLGGWNFG